MRKMQDIILEKMEEQVKEVNKNFELGVSYGAANTGSAFALKGIDTIAYFTFNFQSTYFDIHFKLPNGTSMKNCIQIKYTDKRTIQSILDFFHSLVGDFYYDEEEVV